MYFISDIKKMLSSRIVQITFIFLLVTMLADPISVLIHARRYTGFFENIGANPFQFWLLMNSASWGNKVYNILFWVIPVLATGMIYYNEQSSSMSKFLVVRKSKLRYMLSKVISVFSFTFVFCMFLLSLNLLLTFLIFDVRAPFTEQYQRLVPNAGTFGYTLYQISPLLMAVVYSFFNSLALALFAVFALAIQMIVKFKNQYIAIVIPVILLYAITFAFDSVPLLLPYDIRIIIQPRSANAITEIVTKKDFEITFCAWIVADSFLTLIGLARNKDIL